MRVLAQERLVGEPVREQIAVNRQRDGDVGARPDREVHIRGAASGVVRGSMTTSFAPRFCASRTYGTR